MGKKLVAYFSVSGAPSPASLAIRDMLKEFPALCEGV